MQYHGKAGRDRSFLQQRSRSWTRPGFGVRRTDALRSPGVVVNHRSRHPKTVRVNHVTAPRAPSAPSQPGEMGAGTDCPRPTPCSELNGRPRGIGSRRHRIRPRIHRLRLQPLPTARPPTPSLPGSVNDSAVVTDPGEDGSFNAAHRSTSHPQREIGRSDRLSRTPVVLANLERLAL